MTLLKSRDLGTLPCQRIGAIHGYMYISARGKNVHVVTQCGSRTIIEKVYEADRGSVLYQTSSIRRAGAFNGSFPVTRLTLIMGPIPKRSDAP